MSSRHGHLWNELRRLHDSHRTVNLNTALGTMQHHLRCAPPGLVQYPNIPPTPLNTGREIPTSRCLATCFDTSHITGYLKFITLCDELPERSSSLNTLWCHVHGIGSIEVACTFRNMSACPIYSKNTIRGASGDVNKAYGTTTTRTHYSAACHAHRANNLKRCRPK